MQRTTFNKAIIKLVETFPGKDHPVELMWEYLQDLDESSFQMGVDWVIMNSDQVNKATNLIALIRKHAAQENQYPAEKAWQDVLYKAAHWGTKVEFKNRATEEAARFIGWDRLRFSEDLSYDRSAFIRAYNGMIEYENDQKTAEITDERIKRLCADVTKSIGTTKAVKHGH